MAGTSTGRAYAEDLDASDKLSGFRERFVLDDPDLVYLNGNSLGALPVATRGVFARSCASAAPHGASLRREFGNYTLCSVLR